MSDATTEGTRATINRYLDFIKLIQSADFDREGAIADGTFGKFLDKDFHWHFFDDRALDDKNRSFGMEPPHGVLSKEEVLNFLAGTKKVFQRPSVFEFHRVIADGEWGAAEFRRSAKWIDDSPYSADYVMVFHVVDDKFRELHEYTILRS